MSTNRPNLIYVFADQLGRNHCGYAGAVKAHTPNIDRLAAQGVSFTSAHVNALCSLSASDGR